jgi:hypothetical protein
MKGYQLLAHYYKKKVEAGIAALIHAEDGKPESRHRAELFADEALRYFRDNLAPFFEQNLDPVMQRMQGVVMGGLHGTSMAKLVEDEQNERANLASLFHWA